MFKPEVLAPVGNEEMLKAAVRSGADAVYFGAQSFNARRNADNFNYTQLNAAIKYCLSYSVKAYLTLNIFVKDEEISAAIRLTQQAADFGIDGIIISDIGLADILSKICPSLPLHASTQLTIYSVSALPHLKKLGIKRIVLARELSSNQIDEITSAARRLDIETEAFVHGALCMSMSGQCYLSAMLGSRSGNMGLCAGTCRLPFAASGGTGNDLSLKDLCLLKYVKDFSKAGVTSLKIEGWMKRPEYVAAAVAAYKASVQEMDFSMQQEALKNIFSRSGFTAGYFENKKGRDMFAIRTKEDVKAANSALSDIHELYCNEHSCVGIDARLIIKKIPLFLSLFQPKKKHLRF